MYPFDLISESILRHGNKFSTFVLNMNEWYLMTDRIHVAYVGLGAGV